MEKLKNCRYHKEIYIEISVINKFLELEQITWFIAIGSQTIYSGTSWLIQTLLDSNTSKSEHIWQTNFDPQSKRGLSIWTQKHMAAEMPSR